MYYIEIAKVTMFGNVTVTEWTVTRNSYKPTLPRESQTLVGQVKINVERHYVMLLPGIQKSLSFLAQNNQKISAIVIAREISKCQGQTLELKPAKVLVEWLVKNVTP